jgi:hypothetical protein
MAKMAEMARRRNFIVLAGYPGSDDRVTRSPGVARRRAAGWWG